MRSRNLTAAIAMLIVASCGGDGYDTSSGSAYGDDEDTQDEEGTTSRDAGATNARAKDGGKSDGGTSDAGGGGVRGADDQSAADDGPSDGGPGADAGIAAESDAGADSCATLTYESFGKQFLASYCLSCHGGATPRGGFKLDTLAAVITRKVGVKAQVLSGGMPMGNKKPSDEERARLGQWIDCGPK